MRPSFLLSLTSFLLLGFTAGGRADVTLHLSDPGLPLQELRPLDRRVYIVTLEGKWNQPPLVGKSYYVNSLFPDGRSSSHRVLDEDQFRKGEIRCVLQAYQLRRHGLSNGGKLRVYVSMDKPASADQAAAPISNPIEIKWPMDRPIVTYPPRTRFSAAQAVDAFILPREPRPSDQIESPLPKVPGPRPGATPAPAPGTSGGTGTSPGVPAGSPPAIPATPGKTPEPIEKSETLPPPAPRER